MSDTIIGGNGEAKATEAPKVLEMRIVAEVGKPMQVHFPILSDKIITYGFLTMAEKTLDDHYKKQQKMAQMAKGGIMNFVKRKM